MDYTKTIVNKKKALTFFPSKLAGLSLPVSKPKNLLYNRTNGRDDLIMESGSWINPKNQKLEHLGLPYGIIPRHTILYLCQEYHRNKLITDKPRIIKLKSTLPAFLKSINCSQGGKDYKRIKKQVEQLLCLRMTIIQKGEGRRLTSRHNFSNRVALYWDIKQPENVALFTTYVEISKLVESFFKKSIPLNLETVKKIGGNCLELDLYIWLNYRHYSLIKPYSIGFKELQQQLGANYKKITNFKIKLKKAFSNVMEHYPHNSKITPNGIILQNSKTDIDPKNSSFLKVESHKKQKNKYKSKIRTLLPGLFEEKLETRSLYDVLRIAETKL